MNFIRLAPLPNFIADYFHYFVKENDVGAETGHPLQALRRRITGFGN